MNRPTEMLGMYQQLGYLHRLRNDHLAAIEMFKKMLQMAWVTGDTHWELQAYYHLGHENYYLEEMDKSKYYLERFNKGNVENDTNITKQIYVQEYKIHNKKHYVPPNVDITTLKEKPQRRELPSPSEGRYK